MSITERKRISDAAFARVKAIQFGEPVTNICAGKARRHCFFVQLKVVSYRNKYGISHSSRLARCTDRKGDFWDTEINVIYPGHLPDDECEKLSAPVHAAMYGPVAQQEADHDPTL